MSGLCVCECVVCGGGGRGGGQIMFSTQTVYQSAKLYIGCACKHSLQHSNSKSLWCWLGRLRGCWKLGYDCLVLRGVSGEGEGGGAFFLECVQNCLQFASILCTCE